MAVGRRTEPMARTDDHRAADQPSGKIGRRSRSSTHRHPRRSPRRCRCAAQPGAGARRSEVLAPSSSRSGATPSRWPIPRGARRQNSSPANQADCRGRAACSSRDRHRRHVARPCRSTTCRPTTSNVASGGYARKAAASSLRVVHPSTAAAVLWQNLGPRRRPLRRWP